MAALGEFLIWLFAEVLFWAVGLYTAKLLFPLVSFGLIRVSPIIKPLGEPRTYERLPSGAINVAPEMATPIGVLIWVVVGIGYAIWSILP